MAEALAGNDRDGTSEPIRNPALTAQRIGDAAVDTSKAALHSRPTSTNRNTVNNRLDAALAAERPACPSERLVRVFDELRTKLVSTLWYIIGDEDAAQDAAQDTFLKCWQAQDSLKDVRDLRSWIFRVALNVASDWQGSAWYRRSKQFALGGPTIFSRSVSPQQVAEKAEERERLRLAILRLRQDEKEVFLLRQNSDLTFEQIAAVRRSPVGTVKTQMRSALIKLRRHLTEEVIPAPARREVPQLVRSPN